MSLTLWWLIPSQLLSYITEAAQWAERSGWWDTKSSAHLTVIPPPSLIYTPLPLFTAIGVNFPPSSSEMHFRERFFMMLLLSKLNRWTTNWMNEREKWNALKHTHTLVQVQKPTGVCSPPGLRAAHLRSVHLTAPHNDGGEGMTHG